MEYKTSIEELNRRKRAFATMSISVTVGSILASRFLDFPIPIIGFLCLILVFFLSGILFFRSFDYLMQTKICLSDKAIKRINKKASESFLISNINRVRVKKTTKNTIREIYIWLCDGKSIFITALEDFEQFQKNLASKICKDIAIREISEVIDYDHPLFYSVFGLAISAIGIYAIKLVVNLDYLKTKSIIFVFSIYVFTLGIYFIYARPISKRYGNQKQIIDYIFGLAMVLFGICVCMLGLYDSSN
jgi:hypothetical protein